MTQPFVGEIRMFAGNFAPKNYAFCNGQVIMIAQNTQLFAILGTAYGGDGTQTFALPNLQGVCPLGFGQGPSLTNRALGATGGQHDVILGTSTIPSHTHALSAADVAGNKDNPSLARWAEAHIGRQSIPMYSANAGAAPAMNGVALTPTGGDPHNNMPPYLGINFIIALTGVFPARN